MRNQPKMAFKQFTVSSLLVFSLASVTINSHAESSLSAFQFNEDHLIYTTDEMLSFDVTTYLQQNAPHLTEYAEVISHWSGYSSISPRLLIALIEYNTGLISHPERLAKTQNKPMGALSKQTGFAEQVKDVAIRLATGYYQNLDKQLTAGSKQSANKGDNLNALVKLLSTTPIVTTTIGNGTITPSTLDQFLEVYLRLFPDNNQDNKRPSIDNKTPLTTQLASVPPANYFQLPFPISEYWWMSGSHSNGTSTNYPQTSVNFHQDDSLTTTLTNNPVVAAAPGKVIQHSDCTIEVIHANGWSTVYTNINNIQVATGDQVKRNQQLAEYGNNPDQTSLCQLDQNTPAHQQFSMKQSGRYIHLNNVQLSGYTININPNKKSYDSNCSQFWLIRDETKHCAGRIYNHGIDQYDNSLPTDSQQPTTEPTNPLPGAGKLPVTDPQTANFLTPSLFPGLPGLPDIIPMSKLACQIARAVCNAIPGSVISSGFHTRPLPISAQNKQNPHAQGAMPNMQDICPIIETVCGIVDTLPGMTLEAASNRQ